MSSAHRSRRERREDYLATLVRAPEDEARGLAEGRRQQAEIIAELLTAGRITTEQAEAFRVRYGLAR